MKAVFDSHIHLFERPYGDLFQNSHIRSGPPGELHLYEEYRKAFHITGAFVIGYEGGHCPRNNRFVEQLSGSRPWIYSFGYVPPAPKGFAARARALLERGHFGLSCYLDCASAEPWLASPEMRKFWELVESRRIPLNLNASWRHCRTLSNVLADFPRCIVLLSHMARPPVTTPRSLRAYNRAMETLARHEKVYVKLSGFYAFVREGWRYPQTGLAGAVRGLKERFGAGRLLWGSDFPPVLEHNSFAQALHLIEEGFSCFTSAELERVCRRNAEQIIKERM